MPRVTEAQVGAYLRAHPLPGGAVPDQIREQPAGFPGQRFWLSVPGGQRYVLKRYEPAMAEAARREMSGLQLAGSLGLAPALALADESALALEGPVVVVEEPSGGTVGGVRLAPDDAQRWLVLLLTLHHLPPAAATLPSSMSPDARTWWQRTQGTWNLCRSLYADPRFASLTQALARLHAIVGARLEVHRGLWEGVLRRPCHGNPVPANLVRADGRLLLVEWDGFGQGDPAMEMGRALVLALLSDELDRAQYERLVSDYVTRTHDLRDTQLEERLRVFASVVPLGFIFSMLALVAQDRAASPREQAGRVAGVGQALAWLRETLGVDVGSVEALLAPVRAAAGV